MTKDTHEDKLWRANVVKDRAPKGSKLWLKADENARKAERALRKAANSGKNRG